MNIGRCRTDLCSPDRKAEKAGKLHQLRAVEIGQHDHIELKARSCSGRIQRLTRRLLRCLNILSPPACLRRSLVSLARGARLALRETSHCFGVQLIASQRMLIILF